MLYFHKYCSWVVRNGKIKMKLEEILIIIYNSFMFVV